MADDAEFLDTFMDDYFVECEEHLAAIRAQLLELERSVGARAVAPGVVEDLFRSFHSIKGISGMVELREAEMLAHQMESYLRALRQRETTLSQRGVDALVAGVGALERTIAARRDAQPAPAIDQVLREIAATTPEPGAGVAAPAVPAADVAASWRVTFTPSAELIARGVTVDTIRARLRERGTIVNASPKVMPNGIAFEFLLAGDLEPDLVEAWRADGARAERVAVPSPAAAESSDAADTGDSAEAPDASARLGAAHVVRV